jgi:hypothetical protein
MYANVILISHTKLVCKKMLYLVNQAVQKTSVVLERPFNYFAKQWGNLVI